MLRNFRQVFKGNQMPMTVVMVIVVLGLVAYLAPSRGSIESQDTVMARVFGREVLRRDVDQKVADTLHRLGKQANLDTMTAYLQLQALEYLVDQKLAEALAERHHIVVTDAEVAEALSARLRMYPIFLQQDGSLRSTKEINAILKESGTSLNLLERDMRMDAAVNKLKDQAAVRVPVDDAWLERENRFRNEKISFDSVSLPVEPATVADPGDGPLQSFLAASGARFQVGPRRVFQYVSVQPSDFGTSLEPDENALKSAYETRQADYLELKTSHILFRAQSDSEFLEAARKAEALRPKLVNAQTFNKVAFEVSEDPSAKSNRGELGWMQATRLDQGYVEGAKALKVGEISQPVRSSFGVHLILLEGNRVKPFAEAQAELRARLVQDRFTARAKDRLESIRKAVGKKGNLTTPAQNQGLKAVLSTPVLNEPSAQVEGLGPIGTILPTLFSLQVGETSRVLSLGERFLLIRLQEERPVAVPPLGEIRARVLAAYQLEEARRQVQSAAQAKLQQGGLNALGPISAQRDTTLASQAELAQHPGIRKALLDTPVNQTTPLLWTPSGKLWAARITMRTPAAPLTFEGRQQLVAQIQGQESLKMLQTELKSLDNQGRMRPGFSSFWGRLGGIWINQAAVAHIRAAQNEGE